MRVSWWVVAILVLGAACEAASPSPSLSVSPPSPSPPSPSPSLSPPSPSPRVRLEYSNNTGWTYSHWDYQIVQRAGGGFAVGDRTIDPSLVDALIKAAAANLHPSDGMATCSVEADNDPNYHITINDAQRVELFSTSNCPSHVPWNVVRDGALFVQYDAEITTATFALLAAIDPEHHKPFVRTASKVNLGQTPRDPRPLPPAGFKLASSRAAACRRSVAANPQIRDTLGGPVDVRSLALSCDVQREPACRRTEARASMASHGIELTLVFDCVDDAVEPASFIAQVAAVTPFLNSKVFAAWLAVPASGRELVPDGDGSWHLRSATAPDLKYDQHTHAIDVRAYKQLSDAPFWTALGIAPASRVYAGPPNRARMDLAGHLLPEQYRAAPR